MRTKIVAGNWKMNKTLKDTETLISGLLAALPKTDVRVVVAPSFTNLSAARTLLGDSPVRVAAQNMHFAEHGAYTGEVSSEMLLAIGVETVILGHSERRALFGEDDALLAKKVQSALAKGMDIIFCFGEELEDRKAGNHFEVVENQLRGVLFDLQPAAWERIVLAYEPVWAIGTGETASPEQAQEMHAFIRETLATAFDAAVADRVPILYGGSVKPSNAAEIFSKPDVDGGLIGGASLVVSDFVAIIEAI